MKTIEVTDNAARWIESNRDEEAMQVFNKQLTDALAECGRIAAERDDLDAVQNIINLLIDYEFITNELGRCNN